MKRTGESEATGSFLSAAPPRSREEDSRSAVAFGGAKTRFGQPGRGVQVCRNEIGEINKPGGGRETRFARGGGTHIEPRFLSARTRSNYIAKHPREDSA